MKHFQPLQLLKSGSVFQKSRLQYTRWLLTMIVCLLMQQGMATIYYVSPNGNNGNGLSWATAKTQLNVAIGLASSGDQIWIKAGTYSAQAGFPSNVQNYSFYMKSGVKVYGGFAGTEAANFNLDNRNLTANVTNLIRPSGSGYPIVYYSNTNSTAMLDGVTISGGAANYTNPDLGSNSSCGGGIMIHSASPIISNVIFNNNTAGVRGGAVFCYLSYPTFTNVAFTNNTSGEGGAVCVYGFGPSITNATFTNNAASNVGGAVFVRGTAEGVAITNALFTNNKSGYTNGAFSNTAGGGGAICTDYANCYINNVVFENNRSGGNGGAIYNSNSLSASDNTRINQVNNTVFISNGTYTGVGGGIDNDGSSGIVANCTFYYNYCGATATGGGGIYTAKTSASGPAITSTITNCVFSYNGQAFTNGNATVQNDVGRNNQATNVITYSSFLERSLYGSSSNNVDRVDAPFANSGSPAGPDGKWMTADDGLQLSVCSSSLIDKGNNDATTFTTDLAGQPRKKDVQLVADGGFGSAPIIDMGAYESQNTATTASIAGTIGNPHTVPYPQELAPDFVTNVQNPVAGASIKWQKKENGANDFSDITPASTGLTYSIPNISVTTTYRRAVISQDFCNTPFYSNEIIIKVAGQTPAGVIKGKVKSPNQTGVQGITIRARRLTAVASSPANYTYETVTGADGTYSISPVYYGDPDPAGIASADFEITPLKDGHTFNISSITRTVSESAPIPADVDFTDLTVTSITGKTFQQCTDCYPTNATQTCPIDSVGIYTVVNNIETYNTSTGFIDPEYGRYAISVTDPNPITIKPKLTGHTFSPVTLTVTPTSNLTDKDFQDVTTHTISGRLTAGCTGLIGDAVLEFNDVLPKRGTIVRPSCFKKRVTTTAGGNYTITLPARKYRVTVVSFTPAFAPGQAAYVSPDSLVGFMNNSVPPDSLTRDISTHDTTLNLVYIRPPVISITGMNIICPETTDHPAFALLPQAKTDSFRVYVYQGASSFNCPLSDTNKIRIVTNVQQQDASEEIRLPLSDSGQSVKLKGGIPNITGNNLKDVFIYFQDRYNRIAPDFNRHVLVTGVRPDTATFTTVSPEIPLLILHDPQGDASYSSFLSTQSIQNTMRFYAAAGAGVELWNEVKLGASATVGLGVATDISVWGTIGGSLTVASQVTASNEAIITTTTQSGYSTSSASNVTGSAGDLYVGAALNLIYANSTEIQYSNCMITSKKKLVIADKGFATQYIYSEDFILNTLIPNLQNLAQALQAQSLPDSAAMFLDQVKVWQQVVNNNAENKRRATFVQNYSFDGNAGPYTSTVTGSSTKTSTVEFALSIDATIAAALGFEVAGSGAQGGVKVNFKIETGGSVANTVTNETSVSYTLDDDDAGDYFSINVKKDPVYNTPVFELAAATASCPAEPGAQPRDDIFFTASNPVQQNVAADGFANFMLKIVNTSQSHEARSYRLGYDQLTNVANESIRIAGANYQAGNEPVFGPIAYLDSVVVAVGIQRQPGSSVYTYEGERFVAFDNCGGSVSKTVQVSANFVTPCSNITLAQPADGWLVNTASGNLIFIRATGFTASYSSVELQYSSGTSNVWTTIGGTPTATELTNGYNVDVSSLADGNYNFRFRLNCSSGVVFSQRASGIIERKAPLLFGRPDPTDDNYVAGDIIGFTYNKKLNTNISGLQVTVRRLSNGQLLPATASIYENKIIITPTNSIAGFTGDSIRVIVSQVSDLYGNIKNTADTVRFTIGTTIPGTGNYALSLAITNPVVYKNGDSSIKVLFNLPVNSTRQTRVNYAISGTARYGIDYTVTYTSPGAVYAGFNGSTGSIRIDSNSRQAVLTIIPVGGDSALTANKTIIISLVEGGDYSLGATTSVTGSLTSEDGISVYTFTGAGNFNTKNNWLGGKMPLTTLTAGKEIIINPTGICILNVAQTIRPTAKLTVKANRIFIIQGSLKLN